jgi:hypothetical protein
MKRLAEYSATQPGRVELKDMLPMAMQLAGVKIPRPYVRDLIAREDWREYRDRMAQDDIARTRAILAQRVGEYAETHYQAMRAVASNTTLDSKGQERMTDPRTAAILTEPILDRVWPKKDDRDQAPTTVIVNLAPNRTPETVIVYEVVPIEVVETTTSGG